MRAAEVLEFESLRKLLGRYVSSPQGFRELEKLAPHADLGRLTEDLAEAAEAVAYLRLALRPQPAARGAIQGHGFNSPRVTQSAHPRSSRRFEKRRNQSFVVEDEGCRRNCNLTVKIITILFEEMV